MASEGSSRGGPVLVVALVVDSVGNGLRAVERRLPPAAVRGRPLRPAVQAPAPAAAPEP